jgi:streptogramin lyase
MFEVRFLVVLLAAAATTAASPTVLAKIRVAPFSAPCAAAAGGRYVWVAEYAAPYLLKIDPRTNRILGRTGIGSGSCGLAYGAGSMWIEDTSSATVSRVSVATGKRVQAIPVGVQPYDTTFAYGSAWTTSYGQGDLERIDPATNRVGSRWRLPLATGVVAAFGSVWAAGGDGVIRVDPAPGRPVPRRSRRRRRKGLGPADPAQLDRDRRSDG